MTTLHEIALLRLVALRIACPGSATATEAVRWLTALQAQDYNGTLTSVALRTASGNREGVEAALDAGEIVSHGPCAAPMPDPLMALDVVASAPRPFTPGPALSNSVAFGGHNGCLVLAPYEMMGCPSPYARTRQLRTSSAQNFASTVLASSTSRWSRRNSSLRWNSANEPSEDESDPTTLPAVNVVVPPFTW